MTVPDVLFAPDTPQAVVDAHIAEHHESGHAEFNDADNWRTTATNGSGNNVGDPLTLTWSIAPDGTDIPGFNGEATAPSDLIMFLEGIYGSNSPSDGDLTNEPWFDEIQRALDRWSDVSGLNYVYEPNDDGASFSNISSAAPGVAGVRGDVRIGGHLIDGNSGTLAYNFFPDNGEMVIDTGDSFYNDTSNDSLKFRNVIAHEAGHGFGLGHVDATGSAFLMEPFLSTAFDGPQLDDILGAQRIYGDAYEFAVGNETIATASSLGAIGDAETVTIGADAGDTTVSIVDIDFVSIDDNSDTDVFSFSVLANSSVTISADPVGPTYNVAPSGDPQSPYDAGSQSDLTLELLSGSGAVLATANASGLGGTESINAFDLGASAGDFYVRLTGSADAIQLYQLDVSVTVDAATSTVAIAAANASQSEGDAGTTSFTFDVTRTGDLTTTGTVAWAVAGSGANAADAADFGALTSGTVTFDPGVGTQQITVSVAGDVTVEEDEEFTVTLSNPSTGVSIATASATGVILNDDTSLSIAPADAVKGEGDTGTTAFTFTVTRSGDTSGTSSSRYVVSGNGNPTATANDFQFGFFESGTVSFAAGETTQTVTIDVRGDTDTEGDENFNVTLSSPTGASLGTAIAQGTIINDDTDLALSAVNATQNEGDAGSTAFTFTVVRIGSTSGQQTVDYSVAGSGNDAADAADFTGGALPSGTVTFADGESTQTITINVNGDGDVEEDEGFTVTLANPSGNAEITSATAEGSIINDDVAIDIDIVASQASLAEGDSGTTAFTFLVTRTGFTGMESTVDFAVLATAAGADADDFAGGVLPSGTVTFAVGDTEETVTIDVSGDTLAEADEDFTVTLSNAVNGEIVTGSASSTILNDDTNLSIAALDASQVEGDSGDSTVYRFVVTRSGDVSSASTVDYAVSGDADAADFGGTLPGGTVTFDAGVSSQQIDVTVSGDEDIELDETFTLTLSNAAGATITTAAASSTIENDDPDAPPQPDPGVTLVDGTLTVIGNGDDEYVSIFKRRNMIRVVTYNFATEASTTDDFLKSDVERIFVDVGAGNDQVYISSRLRQDAVIELGDGNDRAAGGRGNDVINGGDGHDAIWGNNGHDVINGGAGDDYLRGGSHNDVIRGDAGNDAVIGDRGHDILLGGDGNDYLNGGNGRDIQIGGNGADWIFGGNSDDILIGGSTAYDSDDAALSAILTEWTARARYNTRVDTIRTGGGSLNGVKLEAGTTVTNDGTRDIMIGQNGRDWFFGDTSGADRDWIFRRFKEVVDVLP